MKSLLAFLDYSLWEGATLKNCLIAFLFILAAMIARKIVSLILNRWLVKIARRTHTDLDVKLIRAIEKPLSVVVLLIGFRIAGIALNLPQKGAININLFYERIVDSGIIACMVWMLIRATDILNAFLMRLARRTESKLDDQLVPLLIKSIKIIFIIIGAVMIIHRLGYDVKALVAGLGIGGLAVALAAQETLKNVFGSIMIFVDKPFQVGDWITVGDVEGTVEKIGFRSTKIRTFPKTLVTIPNSKVADASVNNHSRMMKRRVLVTIGVTYTTSADQMEKCIASIKEILKNHPDVDREMFYVYFTEFADSSLNIMVYYFTKDTSFAGFCKVRQEVNLAIIRLLEQMNISIAFPSQSLYVEKLPSPPDASPTNAI